MDEIISHYLKSGQQMDGVRVWPGLGNPCDARLQMLSLRLLDPAGSVTGHVDIRKPLTIEIKYQILENLPRFRIALRIITSDGTVAFTTSDSADPDYEAKSCTAGFYKTICLVPGDLLNEGFYSLRLSADIPMLKALFDEDNVLGFIVEQTGGVNARFAEKWPGVVCPRLRWRTHGLEKEG
jgi:lipopolysaccharide transport system ATP-binding protein